MTKAVCFWCGSIKWGSLTRCKKCHTTPISDEELLQSLVLSDHHFASKELDELGKSIARGVKVQIEQSFAERMLPTIQRMKPKLKLNRQIDETERNFLQNSIAGRRPQRMADIWINRTFWTLMLLLLGVLLFVLIHG